LGSTALAQIVPLPQHAFSSTSVTNTKGRSHIMPANRHPYGRPRATSLDERQSISSSRCNNRDGWDYSPNDPTLEFRLRGAVNDMAGEEHLLSTIEESE
jgi:hypothetical protein